jgi:hypothetical protein
MSTSKAGVRVIPAEIVLTALSHKELMFRKQGSYTFLENRRGQNVSAAQATLQTSSILLIYRSLNFNF